MTRLPDTRPLLTAALLVFTLLVSGCIHIDDGGPLVERRPTVGRTLQTPIDTSPPTPTPAGDDR